MQICSIFDDPNDVLWSYNVMLNDVVDDTLPESLTMDSMLNFIAKYENHPSIVNIKHKVSSLMTFFMNLNLMKLLKMTLIMLLMLENLVGMTTCLLNF